MKAIKKTKRSLRPVKKNDLRKKDQKTTSSLLRDDDNIDYDGDGVNWDVDISTADDEPDVAYAGEDNKAKNDGDRKKTVRIKGKVKSIECYYVFTLFSF